MAVSAQRRPITLEELVVSKPTRIEIMNRIGREKRREAYDRGFLGPDDLRLWASKFPDEPPTIDGEWEWIARWTPEVCER